MKLSKMSKKEFEVFNKINIDELTAMYSLKMGENEARKKAEIEQHEILPQGVNTKDQFFYTLKTENDVKAGSIWFGKIERDSKIIAFIFYVVIDKEKRGQGYGVSAMKMVEDEIKKIGINTIRLHVLKNNIPASRMYKNLGYKVFKNFKNYKKDNEGEILEKKL